MKQPDFGSFFKCDKFRQIEWKVRFDSNLPHDMQYLSSYLSDARFDCRQIRFERKHLIIPLTRDSWELGGFDRDRWGYVTGELKIYPVADFCRDALITLPLSQLTAKDDNPQISLKTLKITQDEAGGFYTLKLIFFAGAITVRLAAENREPKIVYRDTGALYSHHDNHLISGGFPQKKGKNNL